MSVSELSRRSGISAQTIYSIIKRDATKLDIELMQRICAALEVPTEVFLPAAGGGLTPREWELVRRLRWLDARGLETVERAIDFELELAEREEPQSKW